MHKPFSGANGPFPVLPHPLPSPFPPQSIDMMMEISILPLRFPDKSPEDRDTPLGSVHPGVLRPSSRMTLSRDVFNHKCVQASPRASASKPRGALPWPLHCKNLPLGILAPKGNQPQSLTFPNRVQAYLPGSAG